MPATPSALMVCSTRQLEQPGRGHGRAEDAGHAGRVEPARVGRGRIEGVADAHRDLVAGHDRFEHGDAARRRAPRPAPVPAGMTATPGCNDDSVVTSSSSTACAAVPLASAAQTADVWLCAPISAGAARACSKRQRRFGSRRTRRLLTASQGDAEQVEQQLVGARLNVSVERVPAQAETELGQRARGGRRGRQK